MSVDVTHTSDSKEVLGEIMDLSRNRRTFVDLYHGYSLNIRSLSDSTFSVIPLTFSRSY